MQIAGGSVPRLLSAHQVCVRWPNDNPVRTPEHMVIDVILQMSFSHIGEILKTDYFTMVLIINIRFHRRGISVTVFWKTQPIPY